MNACANPWRVRRSMRLLLANMAMLAAFVVAIQIGF